MKKSFIRIIGIILCMTITVQLSSYVCFAENRDPILPDTENTLNAESEPEVVCEVPSKRQSNVKHFKMSDGSYIAVRYQEPVHYFNGDSWESINNSLKAVSKDNKTVYSNADNPFSVSFADSAFDENVVEIEYKGHKLSWSLVKSDYNSPQGNSNDYEDSIATVKSDILSVENAAEDPTKPSNDDIINSAVSTSEVVYENIRNGVDLSYTLSGFDLRENYVVHARQDSYEFKSLLRCDDLIPEVSEDNRIVLLGKEGDEILKMSAPVMYDADFAFSDDIKIELMPDESGYQLTLTANKEWINDPKRVFPVTIDPDMSANVDAAFGAGLDLQVVNSAAPSMVFSPNGLTEVYSAFSDIYACTAVQRAYMTFSLPELRRGDTIYNAVLRFNAGTNCDSSNNQLNLYKLSSVYNSQTLCWNNQPAPSGDAVDFHVLGNGYDNNNAGSLTNFGTYDFNITKLAYDWYSDLPYYNENDDPLYTDPRHSMVLSFDDEVLPGNNAWKVFSVDLINGKSDAKLIVSYRNTVGYEDYYTYTSIGAGYGGTAYVNCYSGDVSISQPILGIASEVAPVSISLENLRTYAGTNNALIGGGWKTNYNLECNNDALNDGARSIYLLDGDGTKHYFHIPADGTEGTDEDGLGLTIKLVGEMNSGGDYARITDQNDSIMYFNSDKQLYKIADKYGNNVLIDFIPNTYKISRITNSVGHEYTFSYTGTGGNISKIQCDAGEVQFTYDNNDVLTGITYPDQKTVSFVYNDNGDQEGKLLRHVYRKLVRL